MKINLKSLIIICSIILNIIFIFIIFNKNDDSKYKELEMENERLSGEISLIQKQRDSLSIFRDSLDFKFDIIQKSTQKKDSIINTLNLKLKNSQKNSDRYKYLLDMEKKRVDELNKEILEMKSNPVKREGGELLESLKNKF